MSAVLIAAQVLLHGGPDIVEHWLQPLLCALFPWTLHHTHTLRSGTCNETKKALCCTFCRVVCTA